MKPMSVLRISQQGDACCRVLHVWGFVAGTRLASGWQQRPLMVMFASIKALVAL